MVHGLTAGTLALVTAPFALSAPGQGQQRSGPGASIESVNGEGIARTISTAPTFDTGNAFFKPLGVNGRTCATCHPIDQGLTITPDYAQRVFDSTEGLDPLFATVDGTDSPTGDMSTVEARRNNTVMLRTRGLIRVGMPIPANAEFTLEAVDDPYGHSSAADVSLFRRPLPATNLRFLSTVMWDGRERGPGKSVNDALTSQIISAVTGHMQGKTAPSAKQIAEIIDFETHLYTTQVYDFTIGDLDTPEIDADPTDLISLPFRIGINDAFGLAQNRQPFDQNVFDFYNVWLPGAKTPNRPPQQRQSGPAPRGFQQARLNGPQQRGPQGGAPRGGQGGRPAPETTPDQASVARGEKLFNTRSFTITGVAGLNDLPGKSQITGTCSSCHNTPGVGSNSLPLLVNTGIADGARRTPDMPLYTLRNKSTGATIQTTDPGAAMTTGKWADIGKFKVPSLRGLETQSPYMHNGFTGDLLEIVDFYDSRFHIGLSEQDKLDLHAFLVTL